MNKKEIKIFAIGIVTIMASVLLIHSFSATSSYFTSNIRPLPQGLLVCGDDNGTDWDENKIDTDIYFNSEVNKNESVKSCEIYGMVYTLSNDSKVPLSKKSDDLIVPLENAIVAITYIDELNNMTNLQSKTDNKIWRATLTNEKGFFCFDLLSPGRYEIRASKQGYFESKKIIDLNENQNIILNFTLTKTSTQNFSSSENLTKIIEATKTGHVGGEITIWQMENKTYDHEILIYEDVNITKLDVEKGQLSFKVSGNETSTGKTITLNIESNVFNSDKGIVVEYDKASIKMADDINDVLNPNDDGSNPEYLITKGANGIQILISIPHFSEHEIIVYGLIKNVPGALGGINAIMIYVAICIVAAIIFAGSIYIRRKI